MLTGKRKIPILQLYSLIRPEIDVESFDSRWQMFPFAFSTWAICSLNCTIICVAGMVEFRDALAGLLDEYGQDSIDQPELPSSHIVGSRRNKQVGNKQLISLCDCVL